MKQITLESKLVGEEPAGLCGGRLLLIWGCYGLTMEWLWRLAGGDTMARGSVWAVAVLLGLGLLLGLREVDRGAR